jgi:hypothetical protein
LLFDFVDQVRPLPIDLALSFEDLPALGRALAVQRFDVLLGFDLV